MRMDRIKYAGMTFTEEKEICDGEVYRTTSIPSDSLEIGTLFVKLDIRDPEQGGALTAFRRNDKLLYYHGDQLRGTYYIESVTRTGKYTYEITANDAIALLDQSDHMGGIYTGQTVGEIVRGICNIPYFIQSRFGDVKLYGWLPIAKRRANLAQVLFAIGAHAKVDHLGALRIESLWDGISSDMPPDRVFMGDRVTYASKVSEVSVIEHQYIPTKEEKVLFEGTLLSGDIIRFSEPVHNLSASGFSILESGANYAKLSAGTGKLTGLAYAHTTRDVRRTVSETGIPNVVEVKDATLVSLVNSAAVSDRLARYYAFSETMQATVLHENEGPGDVVSFEHPFGGDAIGCISGMSISIGGRLVAEECTLIGYRPPKPNTGYYNEVEIITTDTEWTVPDGVESVRAVLIGGGTGGYSGLNGAAAKEQPVKTETQTVSNAKNYIKYANYTDPGDGGSPGEGGSGGRIYQISVPVSTGQVFSVKIGRGGNGGQPGEESTAGASGADTTFGQYSSSSGTSSPNGFLEEVSGRVYAGTGEAGTPGSSGNGYDEETDSFVTGPPIVVNGVSYAPGENNEERKDSESGTYDSPPYGSKEASAFGGFGGGSAYKANGLPGGAPSLASTRVDSASARGGPGGAGADAEPPPDEIVIGKGGTGGNGGGGGGSGGLGYTRNAQYTGGSESYTPATLNAYQAPPGPGGKGSRGGNAAPGGVILYYSKPRSMNTGQLKESLGRYVLDRLGRRIIV